jgi:hypothetical protein
MELTQTLKYMVYLCEIQGVPYSLAEDNILRLGGSVQLPSSLGLNDKLTSKLTCVAEVLKKLK